MNEEKKLTDEEIIQGMKKAVERNEREGVWILDKSIWRVIPLSIILDLIYRLQNDIVEKEIELETARNAINERDEWFAEQKAEIERLKGFLSSFEMVIAEQQEQIEKKVEEVYPDFMREYKLCKNDLKESLEREAELQKQVYELTENLEKAYATERDNIRAEIANAGTSCHWCLQQAVKDTVKEIYGLAVMYYDGSEAFDWFLQKVKERYGLEVE